MPRLVIFADRGDPQYDRGDVIEVQPTGWFPGSKILQNPRFRIIDLPDDEPMGPLLFLRERDPYEPGKVSPPCKWRIDLDALEAQIKADVLTKFGRTVSDGDAVDAKSAQVIPLATAKTFVNPRVIG